MNYLSLDDDYEEEAYGTMYGLQICQSADCTDPRRGPFLELEEGPYCTRCYMVQILGMDPNEIPDTY